MVNLSVKPQAAALSEHLLRYACTRLETPLHRDKVEDFRRFINQFIGGKNDLFHNHRNFTQYHYRYPLVQYKALGGQACLIGIGEQGTAALQELLNHELFRSVCSLQMGPQYAMTEETEESLWLFPTAGREYRIMDYIALNDDNLEKWHRATRLGDRAALLERCLTGHILKFASAIGWQLPTHSLMVELDDFQVQAGHRFGNRFLLFDAYFRSNIDLPTGIGLGKAVSHGHGTIGAPS